MPFAELLQWLGGNGKTGTLEIERDKIRKRILLRDGRVVGSASNEPRELIGHFLVSRGMVTEDLLRIALEHQETTRRPLGTMLVEMGVLTAEELVRFLSAQAEEILFSLFEWNEAVFRFDAAMPDADERFPIDIRVEDVLLRGVQRLDELQRFREVFRDDAVVPERTAVLPPPEVFRNRTARRVYEAIDGSRAIADILLHAHGSRYLVIKFLFELHRAGLVRLRDVPAVPVLHGEVASDATVALPVATLRPLTSPGLSRNRPASRPGIPALAAEGPDAFRSPLESELERARGFMAQGDYDTALGILDSEYHRHPANEALCRLVREAEAAFVEKAWRHYLPAAKIVALRRPVEELENEPLTPQEAFLLSRIDGHWSVKSIVQIAPIREVDVLRILKHLRDRGLIELHDPA